MNDQSDLNGAGTTPRLLTPSARWLRRTSIDEVPQARNVVKMVDIRTGCPRSQSPEEVE